MDITEHGSYHSQAQVKIIELIIGDMIRSQTLNTNTVKHYLC